MEDRVPQIRPSKIDKVDSFFSYFTSQMSISNMQICLSHLMGELDFFFPLKV